MKIQFYKYQGTGNDFVMVDNRDGCFNYNNTEFISSICDRKHGIGCDGLILIEDDIDLDFNMRYFNSDGSQLGMCGNGARCVTHFAKKLGIINNSAIFQAIDGIHHAEIIDNNYARVKMNDIDMSNYDLIDKNFDNIYLNTGSPHLVINSNDIDKIDVFNEGRKIRFDDTYKKEGVNINFVEVASDNSLCKVRTYERGIEDETLSCGTGAIAVAVVLNYSNIVSKKEIKISMKGGDLNVSFDRVGDNFSNIWLSGVVSEVYKGEINGDIKR